MQINRVDIEQIDIDKGRKTTAEFVEDADTKYHTSGSQMINTEGSKPSSKEEPARAYNDEKRSQMTATPTTLPPINADFKKGLQTNGSITNISKSTESLRMERIAERRDETLNSGQGPSPTN